MSTFAYACGVPGCKEVTKGIYCWNHKWRVEEPVARIYPGETILFLYKGVERESTVEAVKRVNVTTFIEVGRGNKTKRKLVKIPISNLTKKEAV